MAMTVTCPNCGRRLTAPEEAAGKKGRCNACQTVIEIPSHGWEWCSDWHDNNYYGESRGNDPPGPSSGSYRVIRGGSWNDVDWWSRSAFRNLNRPRSKGKALGFRVSLALADKDWQSGAGQGRAERSSEGPVLLGSGAKPQLTAAGSAHRRLLHFRIVKDHPLQLHLRVEPLGYATTRSTTPSSVSGSSTCDPCSMAGSTIASAVARSAWPRSSDTASSL